MSATLRRRYGYASGEPDAAAIQRTVDELAGPRHVGTSRVPIFDVYAELRKQGYSFPGGFEEFKDALIAAHRSGALTLAQADMPQALTASQRRARIEFTHPSGLPMAFDMIRRS